VRHVLAEARQAIARTNQSVTLLYAALEQLPAGAPISSDALPATSQHALVIFAKNVILSGRPRGNPDVGNVGILYTEVCRDN
jgi:hypothetical protein